MSGPQSVPLCGRRDEKSASETGTAANTTKTPSATPSARAAYGKMGANLVRAEHGEQRHADDRRDRLRREDLLAHEELGSGQRAERGADDPRAVSLANEDLVEEQEDQRGSEHDAQANATAAGV